MSMYNVISDSLDVYLVHDADSGYSLMLLHYLTMV